MDQNLWKALTAELVGTFALVFIGAGAGAIGAGGLVGVALAHGLVVVGFAYAYGHISGTHINPAVTIGVWAAGLIDAGRAVSYVVFQLAGGVLGALALRFVLGGPGSGRVSSCISCSNGKLTCARASAPAVSNAATAAAGNSHFVIA